MKLVLYRNDYKNSLFESEDKTVVIKKTGFFEKIKITLIFEGKNYTIEKDKKGYVVLENDSIFAKIEKDKDKDKDIYIVSNSDIKKEFVFENNVLSGKDFKIVFNDSLSEKVEIDYERDLVYSLFVIPLVFFDYFYYEKFQHM